MKTRSLIEALLERRLGSEELSRLGEACDEVKAGAEDARFAALFSMASRYAGRARLAPDEAELAEAAATLEGWTPERWTVLETVRVALVLARGDLERDPAVSAIEELFRYADQGELCALYRAMAHLPSPERFTWRVGEGCRTNMVTVFEAASLDTPFLARHFDEVAWRQAVIKCVFVGAPLWRLWGLDDRLSSDLARMALDLADERRSAHREVQPELWLALGGHGGARGVESLERELDGSHTLGRKAAALGLARAGEAGRLEARLADEADAEVAGVMRSALAGDTAQAAFRDLDPR